MASKEIANNNASITITPQGTWSPSSPIYVKTPASKANAGGTSILINTISWTITGCTWSGPPGLGGVGGGGGSMVATAVKCKCDTLPVMRNGDSGMCSGVISVIQPAGPPVPTPCSCKYDITNAGQTTVKGE